MSQKQLNLGILAHVDAGKTTLTERLLYEAGVIADVGSVDAGTTQTDSLPLERQRGITIRSAVTSFALEDIHVNLIDTPGHPDFIAEVERVLSVLDGAVLVVSAVEGVQPQTRILMRALARLRVPTLMFVNKIDRAGADCERVLAAISDRLTPAIVPMGAPHDLGTRAATFMPFGAGDPGFLAQLAEVLSERDDGILAAYLENEDGVPHHLLREALASQTKLSGVHPVYFGCALTGAGIEPLMAGIAELLPAAAGDDDTPLAGTVFKIERGTSGEKIAYVRLFSGTIRTRDRIRVSSDAEEKVTSIAVFEAGPAVQRQSVSAGAVAKLWGLDAARVGDSVGARDAEAAGRQFPPPTLESVVVSRDPGARAHQSVALAQLAEQDPLINVRRREGGEISISLYGEVQQEVIEATLAQDFGVEVGFRDTTPICVERVIGSGAAVEELGRPSNPFVAGIGFRVDPAILGSGVEFALDVELQSIPLYVYKTLGNFKQSVGDYVRHTLQEGLAGWRVTDCLVTLTHSAYASPVTTAADFRKLTPLVLMSALDQAGTQVCEPVLHVRIDIPTASTSAVLSALMALGGEAPLASQAGDTTVVDAALPAARFADLQRRLPGLSSGAGLVESAFAGYEPVTGAAPVRRRATVNALNREEYLLHLARRVGT